jgi:hypothetical protein
MKKIFIISASALVIILLFLGIYNFAFVKNNQSSQSKSTSSQTATKNNASTQTQTPAITAVSQGPVLGVFADAKNKRILYFSATDGTSWQIGDDGKNPVQISSSASKNIAGAQWSPMANMVITRSNDSGNNTFFLYNYATKASTQLKAGIDTLAWDGLGTKIIYKYFDKATKERSLDISNPDGSNWQPLVHNLAIMNVSIAEIPLSSMISYWNTPTSKEATQFNIVGVTGGTNKTIFSGKLGADYLWSPDGSYALVSSLADDGSNKMTLGVIDAYGANYKNLGVSTLASKCVWSQDSKNVYCAIPGDLPAGTIMPDDYMNRTVLTADTFSKINIQTRKSAPFLQAQDIKDDYDASKPVLSSSENSLFFINRKDGKLYMISL